jgi:hypothetical protein
VAPAPAAVAPRQVRLVQGNAVKTGERITQHVLGWPGVLLDS